MKSPAEDSEPTSGVFLFGPPWSAYTRTVRLCLLEKGVQHRLVDVDFSSGVMPEEQLLRHPFGKVPVFRHDDFQLYETTAICRYIDTAFVGVALQPQEPRMLGRMAQVIAILDVYVSEELRMGYVNETLFNPMFGLDTDTRRVAAAAENIHQAFTALTSVIAPQPAPYRQYLIGDNVSLADCHAAPLFDYLCLSPGGEELLGSHPRLEQWWSLFRKRPAMDVSRLDLSVFKQ